MIAIYCLINKVKYNLTYLCESITISGKTGDVCRQADITLDYGAFTKNLPGITIPDYTPVWVRDENADGSFKEGLISGISIDFSKDHEKYILTVFDFAYYIKRNKVTENFTNTSPEEGTKKICNDFGINVTYLYPTNISISMLISQQNAYDTIMGLYTEAAKQTGEKYFLQANYNNEIGVYRVGNHLCDTLICACSDNKNVANGNLISIEYKETGSNLVNKVNVYDKDNQLIDTITDYINYPVETYGILQEEYVQEDDKDYNTVVNASILHGIDKDFTVEILGDFHFWCGSSVKIYAPWLCSDLDKNADGTYRTAYIRADSHTWDLTTNSYITKLELTLNAEMDEKELNDANKDADDMKNKDEYSSSKVTGASVVKYAKKFLGLPYVWGGTSLESGADCSGFVQAIYAHFGVSIGRTTYEQINDGKAISTTDKSKWKKGDLIFPHSGHVVMYLGNGKVIHEPKTGDVCKISEVYFGTPIAVRRVV